MDKLYKTLKVLDKDTAGYFNLYPREDIYTPKLLEFLTLEEKNDLLPKLKTLGLIEEKPGGRLGLTKAGEDKIDKEYWVYEVYEIIDTQLQKILNKNDALDFSHVRDNLKIKQYAESIVDSYNLIDFKSAGRKEFSIAEIRPLGRMVIEEYHGIKNYVNFLAEKEKEKEKIEETNRQDDETIKKLTISNLQYQDENKELKVKLDKALLELTTAQKEDIPVNAQDRKTVILWQIATGVAVIVAFLLKLFGVKGWI